MKVYLADVDMSGRLEPIGVFASMKDARRAVGNKIGIVTELVIGRTYAEGIGVANHEHLNDDDKIVIDIPI